MINKGQNLDDSVALVNKIRLSVQKKEGKMRRKKKEGRMMTNLRQRESTLSDSLHLLLTESLSVSTDISASPITHFSHNPPHAEAGPWHIP